MSDSNTYDVAKAVRTARQKRVEKLQLGVAHACSHSGRFGNTGKSIDADNTRAGARAQFHASPAAVRTSVVRGNSRS